MADPQSVSSSAVSEDQRASDEGTGHSSDDEGPAVELLVTSRAKRATAGTRMSTLLEKEGDDELELLFAENEQEDDEEFEDEDAEDAEDVQLDSASSDDEQGPTNADDELEGEKELERQTRVDRQKKRKAQDVFLKPGALKKRMKLGRPAGALASAITPKTPATRPKKKSERVSWLPTADEGPIRASSRKHTVQNKEIMHTRLVASEKRRKHQLQVMEEAAKRKEASKPVAMTQAQRMEEAARTERSNARSLNRWEAAEKHRVEEQKAKLEALHNRQLTGPVISWWSGMARWVNGKLKQVGWRSIKEAESKGAVRGADQKNHSRLQTQQSEAQERSIDKEDTIMENELESKPTSTESQPTLSANVAHGTNALQGTIAPLQESQGFLDGIHYYASLPEQSTDTTNQRRSADHDQVQTAPEPVSPPAVPATPGAVEMRQTQTSNAQSTAPAVEHSGRNMVILEDIDANAQRLPELQNHALIKKRVVKMQKATRELCAITEQPARYRDPRTGLPYADSYAYKEMQKLVNGEPRWSSLLGCYVGPTSSAARGVPERFLTNR
ncbi:MAG: hypothetical protein Q9222_000574 [Ikaeria aurantiellina]